jgi:hypothetical protein
MPNCIPGAERGADQRPDGSLPVVVSICGQGDDTHEEGAVVGSHRLSRAFWPGPLQAGCRIALDQRQEAVGSNLEVLEKAVLILTHQPVGG